MESTSHLSDTELMDYILFNIDERIRRKTMADRVLFLCDLERTMEIYIKESKKATFKNAPETSTR